jgi:transcriptional regulator with XRE-family HTH domain
MVKRRTMSDQLRHLIDDCGLSRYEVAKRSKIDHSMMSKFMHGKSGLSLKALDRLTDCLDLVVNMRQKPRK